MMVRAYHFRDGYSRIGKKRSLANLSTAIIKVKSGSSSKFPKSHQPSVYLKIVNLLLTVSRFS
jgi:hypothetical protein